MEKYEPLTDEAIKNTISQVDHQFGRNITIYTKSELEIIKSQADLQEVLQQNIVIKPINS